MPNPYESLQRIGADNPCRRTFGFVPDPRSKIHQSKALQIGIMKRRREWEGGPASDARLRATGCPASVVSRPNAMTLWPNRKAITAGKLYLAPGLKVRPQGSGSVPSSGVGMFAEPGP